MRYLKKDLIQWLRDNQGELIADAADKAWRDDDSYKTLADALESGFNWTKTPGVSLAYWQRLYERLKAKALTTETADALAAENARLTEALAVAQDAKIDADGRAELYKSRYFWIVKQRDYALAEVARLQNLAAKPAPTMIERTRDKIAELRGADVAQAFYAAAMAARTKHTKYANECKTFDACLNWAFIWDDAPAPGVLLKSDRFVFWQSLRDELAALEKPAT